MQQNRQLAAILFTDIVGYTAMMQQDEQTAVSVNKRYAGVMKKYVSLHGGEILNDYGDGNLCTFSSATKAVRAAIEIQQQLQMEPKKFSCGLVCMSERFFLRTKKFSGMG